MSALTDSTNTIQPEAETVGKPIVEEVKKAEDVTPVENVAVAEATEATEASVENTDTKEPEAATVAVSEKTEEKSEEKTEEKAEDAVKESEAVTSDAEKTGENENAEDTAMETEEDADVTADETVTEVEETKEEKEKRFEETLIAGRRFMKTSAFNQATESLSVVAALAEELYGSEHEKTFDVLFVYGQALLELAKMEDGVLNNALSDMPKAAEGEEEPEDGVVENPDNLPEEERADIKHKVEEALGVAEPETIAEVAEETAEKMEEASATEEKTESEAATETVNAEPSGDVEMEVEQPKAEAIEVSETAEAQENEAEADAEAESDDDDTMKLAWEILETARLNCEARIKKLSEADTVDVEMVKTWRLNNADVLTTLGEHGLADSKYPQAQEDLKKALAIQQELLPVTSRIIANTFHLIGKAFAADELFVEAEKQFTSAKDILTAKVDELKKQLEGADEEKTNEINAEIKELEGVIPEIQLLIEDARLTEVQRQELKAEAAKLFDAVAADKEKLSTVETTDISNLVRRPAKRPAEETEKAEEAKKRKSEDGSATIPETSQTTGESETAPAPVTPEE